MAYTSIHPIKATLGKSIDYICNHEKTLNGEYISSENCSYKVAEQEFEFTRQAMNEEVKILGFHAIQSFKAGEVTAEQAHEIGLETMRRMLGGKYEFVIATHVDKACIHNHIIINSVNFENGKLFSREHDRKSFPAWLEMKKYSDEITAEIGLSVIRNAKGKGASHYEWEMAQGNQSWKQKLKNIIDNTLKNSESFEDFLVKIKAQDIEIKYKDYVKKSGKCLGFKMPGQKYFIYAEKLGWYYEEEQLRTRIDRVNQRKTESLSRKTTRKMFETDNRLKSLFDLSEDRFNSYGMHRWGTIENLKQGFKTLNYLQENGFKNAEEFLKKYSELSARKMQNHEQINSIEKKMNHTAYRLKYLRIYREYKPINDRYRKAVFQDKFFRKFEDELMMFREAVEELKRTEPSGVLPHTKRLEDEIKGLREQKNKLIADNKNIDKKLKEYNIVKENIKEILEIKSEEKQQSEQVQIARQNEKNKNEMQL